METLLEIAMEIIMEGTLYVIGDKKVSLWARISLILVPLSFFGFIVADGFLTGMIIVKKGGFFKGLIVPGIPILMLRVPIKLTVDYRKDWKQSLKQPNRGRRYFEIQRHVTARFMPSSQGQYLKNMNILVYSCKEHWQAAMLYGLITEDGKQDISVCMCPGHPSVVVTVFRNRRDIAFVRKQVLSCFRAFTKGRLQFLLITTIVWMSPYVKFTHNRERVRKRYDTSFYTCTMVWLLTGGFYRCVFAVNCEDSVLIQV